MGVDEVAVLLIIPGDGGSSPRLVAEAAPELLPEGRLDFCVPTGNFGDILAAYYAKRMGLPVGKLICASNKNDVLTDFLRTGVYDKNRPFHRICASPPPGRRRSCPPRRRRPHSPRPG